MYEVRDMVEGVDMWIMKASMINRAMGIHIISSVRDVEKIIMDEQYEEIRGTQHRETATTTKRCFNKLQRKEEKNSVQSSDRVH